MKKYKPSKGAQFNAKQAQVLGEIVDRLGFKAAPEQVVDAARPKNSPIHDLFEWDDSTAAERYRLSQARNFVNHLEVVVISHSGERTTKAFHSVIVTHGDTRERGYCSLETIVENEDLNAQVIRKALGELTYWRDKYSEYKAYPELQIVFKAIETAAKRKRLTVKRTKRRVAGAA